jgi:tetratricopeptide (TPR) repeat protein
MHPASLALIATLVLPASLFAGLISEQPETPRKPESPTAPFHSIFETTGPGREKIAGELQAIDRLFQAGDFDKAETELRRLSRSYPKEPAPYVALARIYHWKKQFSDARRALESALQIQESVSLHLDLATVFADGLADPVKALEHVTKAVQLDGAHAGAQYALGRLHLRMGDPGNAAAAFERSIALDPAQALSRRGLAGVLIQTRRFDEALAQLREASVLTPKEPAVFLELGDILQVLNQSKEAAAAYARATELAPQNPFVWAKLGMHQHVGGDLAAADAAYAKALAVQPAFALALNNRAALALDGFGIPQRALAWAREAVRVEPQNASYLDTFGQLLQRSGEHTEAEAVLRRALAAAPDQAFIKLHLAQVLALKPGGRAEAQQLVDALPANLSASERTAAEKLRTQLGASQK